MGARGDGRDGSPGPCPTGDAGTGASASGGGASGQASAVSVGDARPLTHSYLCDRLPAQGERPAFGAGHCGRPSSRVQGAGAVAAKLPPLYGTRSRSSDP